MLVSKESRNKLIDRLSERFSENENVQIQCKIPFYDKDGNKVFNAMGITDVVKDDTGRQKLLPGIDEVIKIIDIESGKIIVNLIEGL